MTLTFQLMIISDVARILEDWAPLEGAEDYDNVGLIVGDPQTPVSGILITHDTLEPVVDEAIEKKYNLIVSFHPIIFSGIKKFTGKTYVERVVAKAIANGIAIYAMHTALDNSKTGVNAALCNALGLSNPEILIPREGFLQKLTTYVPVDHTEDLRAALFKAGAGAIGNYSHCSFTTEGIGSYLPEKGANPTVGEVGKVQLEKENQVHVVFPKNSLQAVLKALFKTHPYEEVAYEVVSLTNKHQHMGMGMLGMFSASKGEDAFLDHLKAVLKTPYLRHSRKLGKPIKKVAVLGGSGAFAINAAIAAGADALVTGDLKYHNFFEAEDKLLLVDVGHFESEQFTNILIYDYLTKKIPNFAVALAERHTNPVYYY